MVKRLEDLKGVRKLSQREVEEIVGPVREIKPYFEARENARIKSIYQRRDFWFYW